MNVSAIGSSAASSAAASLAYSDPAGLTKSKTAPGAAASAADIKKAAAQFESIILRQLLSPTIEPIMSGGLGGPSSAGSGVYGYMLTDVLADSLSKGGGMGLGRMLEKQFSPRGAGTEITSSAALKTSTFSSPLK